MPSQYNYDKINSSYRGLTYRATTETKVMNKLYSDKLINNL